MKLKWLLFLCVSWSFSLKGNWVAVETSPGILSLDIGLPVYFWIVEEYDIQDVSGALAECRHLLVLLGHSRFSVWGCWHSWWESSMSLLDDLRRMPVQSVFPRTLKNHVMCHHSSYDLGRWCFRPSLPQMFLKQWYSTYPTLVPEIVLVWDLLFANICFVYLSQCESVLLGKQCKLIERSVRIWLE